MCQVYMQSSRKRRGFTLIELLVAMTIIIFLATLAVLILPRLNEGQRAGKGADMLQGWLLIAKQRALRSGVACGLRFNDDPNNPNFMNEAYYVEQPPDFLVFWPDGANPGAQTSRGLITYMAPSFPNPVPTILTSNGISPFAAVILEGSTGPGQYDFAGGDSTGTTTIWPVQGQYYVDPASGTLKAQAGDFLELQGGGLLHQILYVENTTLWLASAPSNPPPAPQTIKSYRIIRGSRVLQGEEPLKLPNNVGIYKGVPNQTNPSQGLPGTIVGTQTGNGANPLEILFAPSGRVLSPNVDPIYLWFADSSIDDPTRQNEPVILSIKAATGFISNYPVDTTYTTPIWNQPGNPYIFAQTNRSGGL